MKFAAVITLALVATALADDVLKLSKSTFDTTVNDNEFVLVVCFHFFCFPAQLILVGILCAMVRYVHEHCCLTFLDLIDPFVSFWIQATARSEFYPCDFYKAHFHSDSNQNLRQPPSN